MATPSLLAPPPRPRMAGVSVGFSLRLLALLLLASLLTACGYAFPGSQTQVHDRWKNGRVQVLGQGAEQNPPLAFVLRDRLQARLGLQGGGDGQKEGLLLKILLQPMQRTLVTEDHAGRANLFRITLQAKPVVEGNTELPSYPTVQGTATYYEPFVSTSVQATQTRAEREAMEQLANTLVAVLNTPF